MKRSIILAAALGMAGLGGSFIGCNGGTGGGGDDAGTPSGDVTTAHGNFTTYAVNKLILPQDNKQFAADLNGDGKVDNQMGNIIGTLATQNLDAQSGVDASLAEGGVVVLLAVQSMDASLKSDSNVGLTFYLGKTFNGMPRTNDAGMAIPDGGCVGCPDFSGMGMFTVDAGQNPVQFFGALSGGKFKSNNPVTTKNPVSVTIKVALIQGAAPIPLVLNGAQAEFTSGTDAASGKPGLLDGRLRGSIKKTDVDNVIIPAIASLLSSRIQADPNSSSSKQIASIFDTGGCGQAKAMDGKIDTCEVATNSIIMAVLAPDIQVYDSNGNYAPNSKNTTKDSLSIAVGWSAVQATFTRP